VKQARRKTGQVDRPAGDARATLGGGQVEGHHAVHELLAAGRRRTLRLWVADAYHDNAVLAGIVELAHERGAEVQLRPPEAFAKTALTGAPQGVIAWADDVVPATLDDLLMPSAPPGPFLLVLDGVTDPGNFGSLLRSAACAGVSGVVVARHRSAQLTPAAVKAAAGAVEHVPIALVPGVPAALLELSKAGVWAVGLDPAGEEEIWRASVLAGPVALVVGSEGRGLSRLTSERCDLLVRIPQAGPLQSLNVAAAGAVACFEVARQRAGSKATGASAPVGRLASG
jgi:23S rRNA (guanosine2251-2'-O)-methyltransferase